MANKSGRFAPDFMIMQRRKEEEQRMVYEEKVKTDSTIGRVAHWEQKTSNRLCPCGLSLTATWRFVVIYTLQLQHFGSASISLAELALCATIFLRKR